MPKKQRPCAACKRVMKEVLARKQSIHGPASNRWDAPEDVKGRDAELFNEMTDFLRGKVRHTVADQLWSRTDGNLLTRSKNFVKFMNRISLEVRRLVPSYNINRKVKIPPDEKLRKALRPLISRLSDEQA